jgi:LPS sulfotransferase NodH
LDAEDAAPMRLLLIAQPRTGTTLLRNLLNQHSKIYIYGEIFYPDFFSWGFFSHLRSKAHSDATYMLPTKWHTQVMDYLDGLTGIMLDAGKAVVGFDAKIPHLALVPDIHKMFREHGMSVLHLRRRNTLAAILSYEVMHRQAALRAHGHSASAEEEAKLHVDPTWLALRIAEFEVQDQWINHSYSGLHYLQVSYEDFASPSVWYAAQQQLSEFFEVHIDLPFAPTITKQNSWDVGDLIENAAEIARLFPRFF